jgi:hypothetical protein
MFCGQLSDYFLEKKTDYLFGWHFINVEELQTNYLDILDRLERYGIPLLENPNCTWEYWMGMRPMADGERNVIFVPPKKSPET